MKSKKKIIIIIILSLIIVAGFFLFKTNLGSSSNKSLNIIPDANQKFEIVEDSIEIYDKNTSLHSIPVEQKVISFNFKQGSDIKTAELDFNNIKIINSDVKEPIFEINTALQYKTIIIPLNTNINDFSIESNNL